MEEWAEGPEGAEDPGGVTAKPTDPFLNLMKPSAQTLRHLEGQADWRHAHFARNTFDAFYLQATYHTGTGYSGS